MLRNFSVFAVCSSAKTEYYEQRTRELYLKARSFSSSRETVIFCERTLLQGVTDCFRGNL